MPSTSAKQAKFMRAVAHSPKFAKKVGVSQSVGKDFEMADKKMKKFGDGGAMKKSPMPKEPVTGGPKTVPYTPERKKFLDELERRNKAARDEAIKMAKKATPYKKGGKASDKAGRALVKKSADTMGRAMKMNKGGKCYAAGGLASGHKAANGIAKKGLTKGTQVKMAKGGRMKGCK